MSGGSSSADRGTRRRRVVGILVAVLSAAAMGAGIAGLFSSPGCDGTSAAPCNPAVPLYTAAVVAGIALAVLSSFIGAGFLAFALTCLALGAGSVVGGLSQDMGAFPSTSGSAGSFSASSRSVSGSGSALRPRPGEQRSPG
ncbi:hypothetical protein [Naasia aerilata]|uniref:Uncharacterized protein n=1 Tax=Naasia aerilata TaxID=1162966 RepID=A0ABN6XQM4_9MICO|nr:hypothetical protein [Naasia aerilata]BDZ46473.1 hypothetical protein GCM10025866_23820 [Naasia aerilata]